MHVTSPNPAPQISSGSAAGHFFFYPSGAAQSSQHKKDLQRRFDRNDSVISQNSAAK
jgi:hypothetical protein